MSIGIENSRRSLVVFPFVMSRTSELIDNLFDLSLFLALKISINEMLNNEL